MNSLKPTDQACSSTSNCADTPGALIPFVDQDGQPQFDEPWQAQVMAIADSLIASGTISAGQWSSRFGIKLADAKQDDQDAAPSDTMQAFYQAALAAVQELLAEQGDVSAPVLAAREDAWRDAYLSTPHGHPVALAKA